MRSTPTPRVYLILTALLLNTFASAQQPAPKSESTPAPAASEGPPAKLKELLESNVKAEWEAFKKKDKKAYGDLLADDFVAVEDDNDGMRPKWKAMNEVDHSVVSDYLLFALTVNALTPDSALVTYELTMRFPPTAAVRFKRVFVSEVWVKHNDQWKERYYQETHVR